MNSPHDVLGALYAREIAKRGFSSDSAQLAALAHLERLRTELATAASAPLGKRLLRGLTRDNGGTPRGVYLWGGVGRGKTWLMDLFYSSLTIAQKRRTHFYRFMHEVHADLKRLKGMQSPLEGVADKIAKKAQVICFDELFVSDIADAMILAGLFDALIKRGVALVFTSNVKPKDLYKDGLQRDRFLPTIALDREELRRGRRGWRRRLPAAATHRDAHLPADRRGRHAEEARGAVRRPVG